MRILLLNQYYHPDIAATAQLAADLGAELARRGHDVTAVASARPYAGSGWRSLVEHHDGVRIMRVPATAFGRGNNLLRAVDYASFGAAILAPIALAPSPDVVIALSTPPLIAAAGMLYKRLRRTRFVYWVMDVYPEVAVALGALSKGSLAARASAALSRALYASSDAVVVLDDAMRERVIAAGAPAERVEVIDNWAPSLPGGAEIAPAPTDEHPWRRRHGLGNRFTIAYSGNMGHGHDFDTILGAMPLLGDLDIQWLFIGDGPRRAELERRVAELGVRHVTFLDYCERSELGESLTAAHAQLVCLSEELAGLLAPSKLYGALAAGVPVIYVGPDGGRTAEVVRAGAGVGARNGDCRGLADAVRALAWDDAQRAEMGRRGRELFEARFTRARALERHHALLERIAGAA
jgi:glycosyltransferase involved in cell wall biosynthesis